MFEECYVHIGPPKTGTTSIQASLGQSRPVLAANSIHYPSLEANHQFIVSCFLNKPELFDYNILAGRDTFEKIEAFTLEIMQEFERQAKASKCKKLVLSAEHLVMLEDDEVKDLREYLGSIAKNIYVIVYARHPITQGASMLQEAVKNGARRLKDMMEHPPFFRYASDLPRWEAAFGQDAIILREMHRDTLYNGDIVDDFLHTIGFKGDMSKVTHLKRNESLSGAAVLIADALAGIAPKFSKNRGGHTYLREIAGPKYVPSKELIESIEKEALPHLKYIERKWGLVLKPPPGQEKPIDNFDEDCVQSLAKILNSMSKTIDDLKK